MRRLPSLAAAALAAVAALSAPPLRAQETESPVVMRALDLETAGKYREAAALFRSALHGAHDAGAVLGLERTLAEAGLLDSLLPVIDSLILRRPRESLYRTIQLRTLGTLRREIALQAAFERWTSEVPRDPAPFREYARLLLQLGRAPGADSVIARGRAALGGARALLYETAQLHAARGEWTASAAAWRGALGESPALASAASYALAPATMAVRDSVRAMLRVAPALAGPRQALAELELTWGRPGDAWDALRDLPADSVSAGVWEEVGERALAEEKFTLAREALVAAARVRPSPAISLRAASAALRAGAPSEVLALLPIASLDRDAAALARDWLPLQAEALVALRRTAEADALVARHDAALPPGQRMRLAAVLAAAWTREGDLARARASLRAAGPEADSSEAAGWLALYEGRLADARVLLRSPASVAPELAYVLGVLARLRTASDPALGAAFLALARGDTTAAVTGLADRAAAYPGAAPALLLGAARLVSTRPDAAIPIWSRVVREHEGSAEAAESELEWARALRRRGDTAGAIVRLEHLILSAPTSALLPQARRELELARVAIPPS